MALDWNGDRWQVPATAAEDRWAALVSSARTAVDEVRA
jgi:hypothetical protein